MYKKNNDRLKKLVNYIEENLTEEISYKELSKILLVNEYTLNRIFFFVTNITIAEYIRKRRLSMAAIDLLEKKDKILDIAIKYGYDSGTAFSRAFKKMMGFVPKDIGKNKDNIKYFPVLTFDDIGDEQDEMCYQKLENVSFDFYTISKKMKIYNIPEESSKFWKETDKTKQVIFDGNEYGLVEYDIHSSDKKRDVTYYIASTKEFNGSSKYEIKNKNFLVFELPMSKLDTIGKFTKNIYKNFIPYSGYNLDDVPDIEEYIDDEIIKIYIAIL